MRIAELSEEQQALQDAAIDFARTCGGGGDMIVRDREAVFDREAWKRYAVVS